MTPVTVRLQEMGIILPTPPKPIASYVGWTTSGNQIYVSGQLPLVNGTLIHPGLLGGGITIENGFSAAKICAINILAQLSDATNGRLENVNRILKLTGYVACVSGFTDHPKVINGASEFLTAVFGEAGRHARAAVGVAALPLGACVEIEAIVEVTGKC